MKRYTEPEEALWDSLTTRSRRDDREIRERAGEIIARVRAGGDEALRELSREIDGVDAASPEVGVAEKAEAAGQVPGRLKEAIAEAAGNIRRFHEAQMPSEIRVETAPGVLCVQKAVPIEKVGLYVPGGNAPLFSTVLMLAIPAAVAGCKDIILCTPPGKDGKIAPSLLYAATLCGVNKIYRIGGAQAIAAMALGTESIVRRDKIFGPGNRYVTAAKQILGATDVAIDMPAGPSEVMVMADGSADPEVVAADLLSQAEHGPDSQVMLVCSDSGFADKVENCIARQAKELPRGESIRKSLENSRIIIMENRLRKIGFANAYAAEHLIIAMDNPWEAADRITAAGSIFIGRYSPESAGDYASGTNHTLPTGGWAKSYSGVNTGSFLRKITCQELSAEGLSGLGDTIIAMAEAEGLQAHANAVKIRLTR